MVEPYPSENYESTEMILSNIWKYSVHVPVTTNQKVNPMKSLLKSHETTIFLWFSYGFLKDQICSELPDPATWLRHRTGKMSQICSGKMVPPSDVDANVGWVYEPYKCFDIV